MILDIEYWLKKPFLLQYNSRYFSRERRRIKKHVNLIIQAMRKTIRIIGGQEWY